MKSYSWRLVIKSTEYAQQACICSFSYIVKPYLVPSPVPLDPNQKQSKIQQTVCVTGEVDIGREGIMHTNTI